MDPRRGLVRHPELSPSHFFRALRHTRLEHNLECAHLLVRDGDATPSQIGLGLDKLEALLLDGNLYLAPVEHSLQVAEQRHRQRCAWERALGSVDLTYDHPDVRLSRLEQIRLLLNGAQALPERAPPLVKQALALFEGHFECRVRVGPH
jgi:hypothetical protein